MKYEIVNDKNKTVMQTDYFNSIADPSVIKVMLKSGYKIKVRLIELLSE